MNSQILYYFKEKSRFFIALSTLTSWGLVAFGQPAWSPLFGTLTSLFGFTLFWAGLFQVNSRKHRFYLAALWFMAVEAIHLSWMMATEYQGSYIYLLYTIVLVGEGAQFGLLSLFLTKDRKLPISKILFLSGFWVWMEWLRLFFMSGFLFNPVGLTLSSTLYGKQWVSIGGVYFLSFWVILTNLLALKYVFSPKKWKHLGLFSLIALAPYFYGAFQVHYHGPKMDAYPGHFNALLVQTALSPEEKTGMNGFDKMMPPLQQWSAIFNYLAPYKSHPVDLIVLPERTVPFSDRTLLYPIEYVEKVVKHFFGEEGVNQLNSYQEEREVVDNLFLSQFLSDYFNAQVIVGLEYLVDESEENFTAFSSAFSFRPQEAPEMYHKRVLLPIVEYLPFKWCVDVAKKYHIFGWYQRGTENKVFSGDLAVSPNICIEELYGPLMRKNRLLGCQAFVNITNDVWFPNSRLPKQHYDHGLLRSVENGVPSLRSCNTGVTAAVDALGREVGTFNPNHKTSQWKRGALFVSLSKYQFKTPYLFFGEISILLASLAMILFPFLRKVKIKF